MRASTLWLGTAALAGAILVCAGLILQVCGLVLPFGLDEVCACPVPAAQATPASNLPARRALLAEISWLERDLNGLICLPEQAAPPELPQVPEPEPEQLQAPQVAALEGCWGLDSEYRVENRLTGEITDYTEWTVCFDATGNGRETMTGSDNSRCEGPVAAAFTPGHSLVIDEADDLVCNNNIAILKRRVTCTLTGQHSAACSSFQPDGGATAELTMRRIPEPR